MAGIRGEVNPMPSKPKDAPKGVFVASGSGSVFSHGEVKSAALGGVRKGPPSSRGSKTSAGASHYTNGGLKRGTAK